MLCCAIHALDDRFVQKPARAERMSSTLQTGDRCARPTDADT
jgi:hypothetical protein